MLLVRHAQVALSVQQKTVVGDVGTFNLEAPRKTCHLAHIMDDRLHFLARLRVFDERCSHANVLEATDSRQPCRIDDETRDVREACECEEVN